MQNGGCVHNSKMLCLDLQRDHGEDWSLLAKRPSDIHSLGKRLTLMATVQDLRMADPAVVSLELLAAMRRLKDHSDSRFEKSRQGIDHLIDDLDMVVQSQLTCNQAPVLEFLGLAPSGSPDPSAGSQSIGHGGVRKTLREGYVLIENAEGPIIWSAPAQSLCLPSPAPPFSYTLFWHSSQPVHLRSCSRWFLREWSGLGSCNTG